MAFDGEHIWIIGASSGIGKALAEELAHQGATLILSARSEDDLKKLNKELGGNHLVYPLDVAENKQVTQTVKAITKEVKTLDRIIFMAAIYKPADIEEMDVEFATKLIDVNVMGAIRVSYAVLPVLEKQEQGQIVLCGSVAGFTGLPGGQPYSASKAAIINFAESLYAEVPENIDVKLINPGFVRTRMTDKNPFPMPMRIEPEDAAKHIAKGLKRRSFEIHFPKGFTFIVKFLRALPYCLTLFITRRLR